jgi:hypothetical protein
MNTNLKKALDITTLVGGTAVAGGGILTTYNLIKGKKGIMPIIAGVVTTLVGIASVKYSLDSLKLKLGSSPKTDVKSSFEGEVFEPMNFEGEVFEPMNFAGDIADFYNPKLGRYMPIGTIEEVTPSSQWTLDMPMEVNFDGEESFDGEVFEPTANFNSVNGDNYGKTDFFNPKLGRFSPVGVIKEQSPAQSFDLNL